MCSIISFQVIRPSFVGVRRHQVAKLLRNPLVRIRSGPTRILSCGGHPPIVFESHSQLGFGYRAVTVEIGVHEPHRGVGAKPGGRDGVVKICVRGIDDAIMIGVEAQEFGAQSLQISLECRACLNSSPQDLIRRELPLGCLRGGVGGNEQGGVTGCRDCTV
jgi:hypothetical protein